MVGAYRHIRMILISKFNYLIQVPHYLVPLKSNLVNFPLMMANINYMLGCFCRLPHNLHGLCRQICPPSDIHINGSGFKDAVKKFFLFNNFLKDFASLKQYNHLVCLCHLGEYFAVNKYLVGAQSCLRLHIFQQLNNARLAIGLYFCSCLHRSVLGCSFAFHKQRYIWCRKYKSPNSLLQYLQQINYQNLEYYRFRFWDRYSYNYCLPP